MAYNRKQFMYRAKVIVMGIFLATFVGVPFAASVALAAESGSAISQGFMSRDDLVRGTLVTLSDANDETTVAAANVGNVERLVGVVDGNPLVELSTGEQETQVVISGTAMALVSDVNGDIMVGDKVTASPFSGVGMKAVENTQVVGTAKLAFSAATDIKERQVTTQSGEQRTIRTGLIPVQVNVAYFQKKEEKKSFMPEFLQRFVEAVAGREVSPVRALIAIVLLITGIAGIAGILFSSVRSSIISIGRNPLAAKAVHRGLLEVSGIVISILLAMLVAVYLVLVT